MKSQRFDSHPDEEPVPTADEPVTADARCVVRVLAGESAAFQPLVEAYEAAVFGLCRRLLGGSEAEAEDLCQETFLRAFRRLAELKDPNRFGPWLFQIARSLCRDRVRHLVAERRALERRLELDEWALSLSGNGFSGRARRPEPREPGVVARALAEMPALERQALELKYFEGLSYQEIAREMGLTFARVDHLIRQARARLARRVNVARQRERHL